MYYDPGWEIYRPFVLKLAGKALDPGTSVPVRMGLLLVGFATLGLPTSLRQRLLFRVRNDATWRIAKDMRKRVHIDLG